MPSPSDHLVGGAITSGIGWRWIFFVNVPIGIVAIILTMAKVQDSRDPNTRRSTGSASLASRLLCSCSSSPWYGVTTKGGAARRSWGCWSAAAVLLVVFVVGEWLQKEPMLDLHLFKRPAMVGVSLVAFTIAASIFALFLYLTLYIQDDLGFGPFPAGVRFLPLTMLAFIVAPFAGRLTNRVHSRYLLGVGMLLIAIGCALMATTTATSGWTVLLPGFIVCGIGIGTTNPVLASSAVSVVPPERSGMASGANNTFRQVGIATGIAALGAIFQSQIQTKVVATLLKSHAGMAAAQAHSNQLKSVFISGQVKSAVANWHNSAQANAVLHAYRVGFSDSLNELLIIAAVIALIGSIGAFALVRQKDFVPSFTPAPAQASAPAEPSIP